jgi:ribosomal protein S18 acetylase RimI-like enzyme
MAKSKIGMNGPHLLDNPVWHALTTAHAAWAQGDDFAKRYPSAVGPLAAIREPSSQAYNSLAQMHRSGDVAALVFRAPPETPPGFTVRHAVQLGQLACTAPAASRPDHEIELLRESDIPEMLSLTELTKPGPFGPRTAELGTYLGIRRSGRLLAMAGVRLRLAGYSEISAVCTHPEFRGRGYAKSLVSALILEICERGETPFLHVKMDNADAVHVYEKLGFGLRNLMHLAVLRRN